MKYNILIYDCVLKVNINFNPSILRKTFFFFFSPKMIPSIQISSKLIESWMKLLTQIQLLEKQFDTSWSNGDLCNTKTLPGN